jgi:hypothetical protein
MKAIIQTQHMENYGAHDWDGKGECPQYWKPKFGNTYIFTCTIEENMSPEWWARVEASCTSKSEYFEEYSVGETVVDDIDFRLSDHCEEWDAPYYGTIKEDRICFHRTTENRTMSGMRNEIAKQYDAYDVLNNGEQVSHGVSFEMVNGDQIRYSELRAWLDKYAPEEEAA